MMKKILLTISLLLALNTNAAWESTNISTAVFALDVVDRTPQNIVSEIDNSVHKIYFYTNLRNLAGQKIIHRWTYNDKVMAEVKFSPKSNRWRVYSSKNLWKNWTGKWQVEVIKNDDEVLLTKNFNYKKAQ